MREWVEKMDKYKMGKANEEKWLIMRMWRKACGENKLSMGEGSNELREKHGKNDEVWRWRGEGEM
jgi:hypothetical protein